MLTSSPSGTDSHLVIYLKGCLALTVLHFGSGPDKPLNNILPLANSGPVCRTHLKNMPLITSKRHMTGVSNYKVHGWSCSHSSKASLFTLFLCFTYCLCLSSCCCFLGSRGQRKARPKQLVYYGQEH